MTTTVATPASVSLPGAKTDTPSGRLMSLDALRGFDMFWILGGDVLVMALRKISDAGPVRVLADQMDHVGWAGFHFYDLIFPMFVFIVGVSLTFSLGRTIEREGRAAAMGRLLRRAFLLYILGIFYYGGFGTPFEKIRLLGVLQRIALGYLFAGLAFCWLSKRGCMALAAGLLMGYWALLTFVPVPGIGAGHFAEGQNLTNWIDAHYLPLRKWDGDHDPEGLLSTLPAIANCLFGVFAGMWLRRSDLKDRQKVMGLAVSGVVLVALGWLWHGQFPVIKKLWTSSFVFVACGYSCAFLAAFYWMIEMRQWRRWAQPFVWIGMNPITLYLLHELVNMEALARRFIGGDLNQLLFGRYGELAVACVVLGLTLLLSHFLAQRKIFLRV